MEITRGQFKCETKRITAYSHYINDYRDWYFHFLRRILRKLFFSPNKKNTIKMENSNGLTDVWEDVLCWLVSSATSTHILTVQWCHIIFSHHTSHCPAGSSQDKWMDGRPLLEAPLVLYRNNFADHSDLCLFPLSLCPVLRLYFWGQCLDLSHCPLRPGIVTVTGLV